MVKAQPTAKHTTTSGALLAMTSLPIGVFNNSNNFIINFPFLNEGVAVASALLWLLAGLTITRGTYAARSLATVALAGTTYLGAPILWHSPQLSLTLLLAITGFITLLWKVGSPLIELSQERLRPAYEGRAQGASWAAICLWLGWTYADQQHSHADAWVVGWPLACCLVFGLGWVRGHYREQRLRGLIIVVTTLVGVVLALPLAHAPWSSVSVLLIPATTIGVALRHHPATDRRTIDWWEPFVGHPERLFVGTFALLCLAGTLLLALPQSASDGASIGVIDALFTATSAVCVTGLIVLDTPVDFSAFGQAVLLLLIQVGGLGIMTFSTAALWAFGRRLSLKHEGAVARLISTQDRGRLFVSARRVVGLTVVCETLGAVMLCTLFVREGDGFGSALWRGLFTSISAFCNAGFALQSDSLIPYQDAPLILHTISLLIIVGGLSPLVIFAIPTMIGRRTAPVSAQARLALAVTIVLLLGGFVFFAAFEWNSALANLHPIDKLHNAWFQSVTLRSAGFNSVDFAGIRSATLVLTLVWMFIGGTPGGTAGGVKTTTVGILVLSVFHAIRGQYTLNLFGKRIPERTRTRAAVVIVVAATTGIVALVAVLLTQDMRSRTAVFEVVSALGTVGLTMGGTSSLDAIGKVIIAGCMFMGRVGGLTLLLFLSSRVTPFAIGRPEEEIDVG